MCSHMPYVAVQAYTLTEQKQITEHAFSYLPTISVKHVLHVDNVSFDNAQTTSLYAIQIFFLLVALQ